MILLVWTMFPHPTGVFCTHLEGPKSHIRNKMIIPVLLDLFAIDPFKVGMTRSKVCVFVVVWGVVNMYTQQLIP